MREEGRRLRWGEKTRRNGSGGGRGQTVGWQEKKNTNKETQQCSKCGDKKKRVQEAKW